MIRRRSLALAALIPPPAPLGRRGAGFEATATIKRSGFGSTSLGDMVGDDVTLRIEAEFEKQ